MRLKQFLIRWLKRDGLAIFFFGLATVIMSYPLVFRLGGDWVSGGGDVSVKLWDIWRLGRILTRDQAPFFTRELFYPNGVSLAFHNLSWTTSALSLLLVPVTGSILSAFKVTILVGFLAVAYAAYLLILDLTQNRSAAWIGGAIYAYAPFIVTHSRSHPDVAFTAAIPIATLLFMRAIRKNSRSSAVGAALAVGLAAFTSMYILTFVVLTLGLMGLFLTLENRRWRTLQFWKISSIFAVVLLLILGFRFYPWLTNLEAVTKTIDSVYEPAERQADLLAFIIPARDHKVFEPIISGLAKYFGIGTPYLGIVPVALTLSALTWKKRRQDIWPWFLIAVFFFLLSLGSVLKINGRLFEQIPMLLPYLDWFPPLRGVRTNFYHVALLLPLAVCSAFGLSRWLKALKNRQRLQIILVVGLTAFLLFEYWNGPYPLEERPINQFYVELASEPDDFAIIQLPMGRRHSKDYLFQQTSHQKPIVEGAIARTPTEAYQYIQDNPLLLNWFTDEPSLCRSLTRDQLISAKEQLLNDNFRYVIIHHLEPEFSDHYSYYFSPEPVYQDDELTVYKVADLRDQPACPEAY